MPNFVASLASLWKRQDERIMIFGNDFAGKTTLLYRFKLGEVVQTIPTMGFNVETIEHKRRVYTLWDVGGCDKIRPLWRHYLTPGCHAFYIHNCTEEPERQEESFEALHMTIEQMTGAGAGFIFVIINKQDALPLGERSSIVSSIRQRFEAEFAKYGGSINGIICDLPGFSATTYENVFDIFDIVQQVVDNNKKAGNETKQNSSQMEMPTPDRPSRHDLMARIEAEGSEDTDSETFWKEFVACNIAAWNHRNHLRAGYFVLLETLREGKGIFEAAETFLEHLSRLKDANTERFRKTEHRTMTIFWLYNLQLAILEYKQSQKLDIWPTSKEFQEVLLHSPYLMFGGLWKEYYSKDLLFSPEAKEYWRLPDLQALPEYTQISSPQQPHHVRRYSQEEPYRVMRFAFTVVKKYMSSNMRRGWVVMQALASLQSTTMRLRAKNPSIPPYSETQAYFWIQLVHAALASVYTTSNDKENARGLSLRVPLSCLSFSSFWALFDIEPIAWRRYYTPQKWDSIEARMAFVVPDLKSLPDVINIPSATNIDRALSRQLDSAKLGMAAELPSMEDLALSAAIILDDTKSLTHPVSPEISSHAQFLFYLYTHLINHNSIPPAGSPASLATDVLMQLSGPYVFSFTQKAFWTQQILGASVRGEHAGTTSPKSTSLSTFEDFIKANLHLVYEDLPLCYYSPELLQSLEAKEAFVPPDRRRIRGFLPTEDSQQEDDWVVV